MYACVHACVYSVHEYAYMGDVYVYTCVYDTWCMCACIFTGMFPCVDLGRGLEVDVKMSSPAILHTFSQTGSPDEPVILCFSLTDWTVSPDLHPAQFWGYRCTLPC